MRALVTEDMEQQVSWLRGIFPVDDADATTFASVSKVLAFSEADYVIPFGGVAAAKHVVILASQEVSIKLNGIGAPAIPIRPTPPVDAEDVLSDVQLISRPGMLLLAATRVTSIHATNPSGSVTAAFTVFLIGEAAA